jgi:hypothetical protein
VNAAQEELFDLAILRVLDANRTRYGLGLPALAHLIPQFGFPHPDVNVIADRIEYLTNKNRVEEVLKEVNKANRAWRITEAGINHVDQHG